jgi:UDP-N-acetylmuramyl pentapeptide phosphotransferase/UDP-N-acetylglucosamine-1-phosphate transferase
MMVWLVPAAGVAAMAAAVATRAIRDYSRRRSLLDMPGERSSHSVPTPRLGGVAIAGVCLSAWLVCTLCRCPGGPFQVVLFTSAILAALTGLVDDIRGLSPATKLAGQLVAVLPVLLGGEGALAAAPWLPVPLVRGVECLWVLGYTNVFNFMDGSDGLAGGTAVVGSATLALVAWGAGLNALAWPIVLLGAASGGFLRYNWAPASIFMGDSGSLFIGASFSVAAVGLVRAGVQPEAVLLAFTPFMFDGLFTLARRASRGEPVWRAHRSHLYQRLLITGKSHAWVARLYLGWAALSGAAALLLSRATTAVAPFAIGFVAVTGGLLVALVWREERRVAGRATRAVIER